MIIVLTVASNIPAYQKDRFRFQIILVTNMSESGIIKTVIENRVPLPCWIV